MERHLGLPKKALYQAYLLACRAFDDARKANVIPMTLRATSVLLLANPAHSTALNARKRLVLSGHRDARLELQWTAAILSEQQAAKASLLWHHRRWLLRRIHSPDSSGDDLSGFVAPLDELQTEIRIAERACEAYRRNYFAWVHRLRCVQNVREHPTESRGQVITFLDKEISAVQGWIDSHVSDHTAVHIACELLLLYQDLHRDQYPAIVRQTFGHAASLVEAFSTYESLWLYLRRAFSFMSSLGPDEQVLARTRVDQLVKRTTTESSSPTLPRPKEEVLAARCSHWLELDEEIQARNETLHSR